MDSAARLARLERRFDSLRRRNRLLGAALLTVVAAGLAAFALPPGEVVKAAGFEMLDEAGRARAVLRMEDGGPALVLLDEQGRTRTAVVHDPSQSGFMALDEEGQIRVGAVQFAHGGGGYALHGPQGKGAAVLYLKGKGSLSFYGEDGAVQRYPEKQD